MNKNIAELWAYNLRIHYVWTFLMSFAFLSPVIGLYYQFYWLDISNIVFISSIYYFFVFLLEIPTSTLWDNWGRVKTMLLSIGSSFFPLIIYLFFPSYDMFIIAVFFSALWQALWSGNAQAKLEDDLKALWKKADFWKTIWKLISLTQIWKLLTPVFIFIILKYLPNSYQILAFLDLVVCVFVFLAFFKMQEIDPSYINKSKGLFQSIRLHATTILDSFAYLKSSKSIIILLISMIFGTDLYLLAKVILPVLFETWTQEYISSVVVWFATWAWILWSLSASKIASKCWWVNSFTWFVGLNMILHFLAFAFYEDKLVLTALFVCITFSEFAYMPVWNHILMDITSIRAKATIRSLFLSILLLYQFIFLFVLSYVEIRVWLLIIWFFMILSILLSRHIVINEK